MNYKKLKVDCSLPEYSKSFWDFMRGDQLAEQKMAGGNVVDTAAYAMPDTVNGKYENAIARESVMRRIASVLAQYGGSSHILAAASDDVAEFVPEAGSINVQDVVDDFTKIMIGRYKLATLLRLSSAFVTDAAFDLEGYLVKRLAKAFARTEDQAFISGTGMNEPVGLLDDTEGAETGAAAEELTFDAVIEHYFSVKPEYRKNGVWLMNDETALTLKKLKDDAGNYLWRGSDDTIMGKPVMITEYMPNAEAESKPILFGDFSYYWIVKRSPVTVKMLRELFALNSQVGYLAFELIDGRLVRREAVKALQITA